MLQSVISRITPIIDETNWLHYASPHTTPEGMSRGYICRDYEQFPQGTFGAAFDIPLIPQENWETIILKMERERTRLSDMRRYLKLKSLDQNGTNFCWVNAVVNSVRLLYARQGKVIDLSPASVGSIITNFSNQGGWGAQALKQIIEHGVTESRLWPNNGIDQKYYTAESKANAALHKVTEWYELGRRSFAQLMTCVLNRIPVPIGLNWWGHEVLAMDGVVIKPGVFGIRIWNSWADSWGDLGEGILSMEKATPDDAVGPRVALMAA